MQFKENNTEVIKEWTLIIYLNNECNINNTNSDKDMIAQKIIDDIENGLLDSIISNVIGGEKKDLVIKGNNIIYQITSAENQKQNKNKYF